MTIIRHRYGRRTFFVDAALLSPATTSFVALRRERAIAAMVREWVKIKDLQQNQTKGNMTKAQRRDYKAANQRRKARLKALQRDGDPRNRAYYRSLGLIQDGKFTK